MLSEQGVRTSFSRAGMMGLIGRFEKVISEGAFLEWMRRLEKCIRSNGEYVGGDEQNAKRVKCFSR
jgi:hypothetical protein